MYICIYMYVFRYCHIRCCCCCFCCFKLSKKVYVYMYTHTYLHTYTHMAEGENRKLLVEDLALVTAHSLLHHNIAFREWLHNDPAAAAVALTTAKNELNAQLQQQLEKLFDNVGCSHFFLVHNVALKVCAGLFSNQTCKCALEKSDNGTRQYIKQVFCHSTGRFIISGSTDMFTDAFNGIDLGRDGFKTKSNGLVKVFPYMHGISPVAVIFSMDTYFEPGE